MNKIKSVAETQTTKFKKKDTNTLDRIVLDYDDTTNEVLNTENSQKYRQNVKLIPLKHFEDHK